MKNKMGIDSWPVYGEVDLGSAIETNKKIVEKIESNKFDKQDLIVLARSTFDIVMSILQEDE